jgi:hypothetical protein
MWTLILALAAQADLAQQAKRAQPLPGWMAGCWEQRSGDRWTEECWTRPRGNMMMGSSRSGSGGVLTEWETMQIFREESDDPVVPKLHFWASPGGEKRTMFAWVPTRETGVTFVSMDNDYPQRIRYWREGRDLMAEISLADGSKPRRWRYSPAR